MTLFTIKKNTVPNGWYFQVQQIIKNPTQGTMHLTWSNVYLTYAAAVKDIADWAKETDNSYILLQSHEKPTIHPRAAHSNAVS